jgi:transcription-repair coupling factor (superfamily II helicase)
MALRPLLNHASDDPAADALARDGGSAFCSPSLRAYLLAAIADHDANAARPALIIAPDDRAARDLAADLHAWLAPRPVRFFPGRGIAYESHLTPPPHLVGLRVAALDALLHEGDDAPPVVVASAVALAEKIPDPSLRPQGLALALGDLVDRDELAADLVAAGYERVEQVEERGQFAVRGDIVDLYPATEERAVRVELFGDEVESLRWFSTFTQRSLGDAEVVEVAPAAELNAEHRELAEIAALEDESERPDIAEILPVDQFRAFLDLVPDDALVALSAEEEVEPALRDLWQDVTSAFHDADAHDLYVKPEDVIAGLEPRVHVRLTAVPRDQEVAFHAQAAEAQSRSLKEAEAELERLVRSGYRTVVAWPHRGEGERASFNLARLTATWLREHTDPEPGLRFVQARLRDGFVAAGMKLAVIPEHRLLRRRRTPAEGAPRRGTLRSFADLRTGDVVVHEDHGVARFAGFDTRTVASVTRDYLQLEYQGTDKVYLPVDQLAKISRYVGGNTDNPPLSKLGGKSWEAMKARARRAAQELAGELLNLYAERRRRTGHAFAPDGDWQREFEERFPHAETPDQRDAIDQVKSDMETPRPMDRLIVGDVGYGKTEVALRAAFKSVTDGKQVLVLVPTTILAQQHYGTFAERLADWPFTIEHVSRFRSAKEQTAAIKAFNEGKVDILVGTHRLLGRDVRAKDLGLIVVDEEQRFGVKQKELLRQLRLKVDVIAMSATPIPRTLQMSMAGIRDMSVIETPPEGRRPVRTYVGEYDEELVRTALLREKERGGQAFFLHNRVETIEETAERLRGLCPGLTFVVAHGQLDEHLLEEQMLSFLRREADVLVSTSIIESGIDIPQANTLIVERSDTFGLAQLYQLRGRVGRSRERAFAYLLYPSAAALTPEAAQRLSALADYTELGAGVKIALRDLEIRGSGNLLGDEQSGHVAALGFELYLRMLDDAVKAAGGEGDGEDEVEPVRLDVNVDAYVPADYVPFEQAKIDIHRRIAGAQEVADVALLREELEDRFGAPPQPVQNLLALQEARVKLGRAGARTVSFKGGRLAVTPIDLDSRRAKALRQEIPEALFESGKSQVSMRVTDDAQERFPAVVKMADVLLALVSDAAAEEPVAPAAA